MLVPLGLRMRLQDTSEFLPAQPSQINEAFCLSYTTVKHSVRKPSHHRQGAVLDPA